MNKEILKKTGDELQEFLAFRKRASRIKSKKGKGSYNRSEWKKERQNGSEALPEVQ